MSQEEITVDNDTAETGHDEDQSFDTLDDAVDALVDDEPTDEQTDSETEELPEDEKDSEDGEDFEEGEQDLVTLDDGESVPLEELKKGYFRNKDYTHKTEELAQMRNSVDALRENYQQNAQTLQSAYQNLTKFLEGLIPPEPDIGLAQSNPGDYQYQIALRNNAIAELEKVYAAGQQVDSEIQNNSQQEWSRFEAEENTKLLSAMPSLKDPGRRAAFDAANKKTAADFGFSEQEFSSTADHRILQLVHYARLGKQAEQNRKNAKRRLADKPRKGARSTPVAGKPSKNREAMKRLRKNGTLEAAMAVDFD